MSGPLDSSSEPGRPDPGERPHGAPTTAHPACPVCGGLLVDIRAKLQCRQCGRICETCCEGGPG